MVKDVSTRGFHGTSAVGNTLDRCFILHGPGDFVAAVDRLLHEAATAHPDVVIPVAHLPLDVAHAIGLGGLGQGFDHTGVIGRIVGLDVADLAIVNALESFPARPVVAPAEPGRDRGVVRLGDLRGFEDGAYAKGIRSHRLLTEDVLLGFDCSAQMLGSEAGWGGEQDDVNPTIDHLLERIQACEGAFRGDIDFVGVTFLETADRFVGFILEGFPDRPEFHIGIGVHGLLCGTAPAPARSDEPDLQCAGGGGAAENRRGSDGTADGSYR